MQKIIYSPQYLSSTLETKMNSEGSEIIIDIETPSPSSSNICSMPNTLWYGPVQNLSIDSKCVCPNLIKSSKRLSGITYYKCNNIIN
jgi:hypothetical protein